LESKPDISVIYSTYNRGKYLYETLEAMCEVDRDGIKVEFVVVDNNSSDDTAQVIDSFADRLPLCHLFEPRPGKNCALNHALDSILVGDIVVFTDDDVVPCKDWLKQIADACAKHTEFDVFGGKIIPILPEGVSIPKWATEDKTIRGIGFAEHDLGTNAKAYQSGSVPSGPNFWVRGEILRGGVRYDEAIGPDGSNKFRMGSESELLLRLANNGARSCYYPDAIVGHHVQPHLLDTKNMLKRAIRYGRGKPYLRGIPDPEKFARHPWPWRLRRGLAMIWHWFRARFFLLRGGDESVRMKNAMDALSQYAYHRESLSLSFLKEYQNSEHGKQSVVEQNAVPQFFNKSGNEKMEAASDSSSTNSDTNPEE